MKGNNGFTVREQEYHGENRTIRSCQSGKQHES
jgi:hypothetical protein